MRTLNLLFGLLLIGIMGSLHAQIIENDGTKVLDSIRGEPIFSLEAEVDVYSYQPEDDWYKIRREVYVDPGQVVDDKSIMAGTELRNEKGKVIGSVLREMKIAEGKQVEGFRGDQPYRAILEGYLFKTKFEEKSAPEEWISEIFELKNRTEQQEEFEELYDTYDFEEREFDEFTVRAYREENKTLAEEKDFRLIIVFRGGTTPYAVIANDHENVKAPKVKMEVSEGPYNILYFYKPPTRQKEIIEEEILYTYLAL